MHVDQEPVGARNTCWLVSCGMAMRYDEGWGVHRIARAAPGAWPGIAGGCHAAGAQTRSWSPPEARELGGGSWSTCPAPIFYGLRGWRVEPPGCARDRATLHLAPEDAVTPPPATGAPAGPFMPPHTAPPPPVCPAAPCTGSCARCLAIGRPSTRRGRLQPGPSGDCAAYLRTSRSAPIPHGRADA